jgi:FKBP-type peptidyl-prolyl cis-trans isomerase
LGFDAEVWQPQSEQFIDERRQQYREAFKEKQIAAVNTLFATLSKDTNVVTLPDGLRYEIVKPGNTHFPRTGEIVLVNYTGQTLNGHVFDQTVNEPLHVEVGRVMPGWSEGIQKIGIGGTIYIPPWLGYGGDAVSGIPANSTLIYDIKLLDIQEKSPDSDTAGTGEK